ncbi:MAG: glycosyltransferase family 2 protein [Anaeroplasmataceae bacterium]
MKNPKISFVALCYNQQLEIIRAIKSIIFSRIPDDEYEIIIVDDGSTDLSVEKINSLSNKNIKIISLSENTRNQSLCRNIGIANSTGEWIFFMDGDDYYNSCVLYDIYTSIDDSYDIIFTNVLHHFSKLKMSNSVTISNDFVNPSNAIDHGVFTYIFKRVLTEKVLFDEITYNWDSEDCYFTYRLFDSTDKYLFLNIEWCYYHKFSLNSNTVTKYADESYLQYMFNLTEDLLSVIKNKNICNLVNLLMCEEVKKVMQQKNGDE